MKLFKSLLAQIAVRRHPDKAESWVKLGLAHVHRGRRPSNPDFDATLRPGGNLHPDYFAAAISAYQHAISLKPDCAEAWACLGRAYMLRFRRGYFFGDTRLEEDLSDENQQGLQIAVDALKNATRIEPNNSILWNDLGFAYSQVDRFDGEINAYHQDIKVQPECKTAWHNLTTSYYNQKDWEKLVRLCKEALDRTPFQAHIWSDLGYANLQLGRFEDAKRAYNQAKSLTPSAIKRLTVLVRRSLDRLT